SSAGPDAGETDHLRRRTESAVRGGMRNGGRVRPPRRGGGSRRGPARRFADLLHVVTRSFPDCPQCPVVDLFFFQPLAFDLPGCYTRTGCNEATSAKCTSPLLAKEGATMSVVRDTRSRVVNPSGEARARIVARFREAWRHGGRPALDDYLPLHKSDR